MLQRRFLLLVLAGLLGFGVGCLKPAGIRYPKLPTLESGALHVVTFDVGQADATLVLFGGKSLLIDAGQAMSEPNKVKRYVPRRLEALTGRRHLDYVLLTHYHRDHIGAPGRSRGGRTATGLYALLERKGVTVGTILDRGFWQLQGKASGSQRYYRSAVARWLAAGIVEQRRELRPGDLIDMGPGLEVGVIAATGNAHVDRLKAIFPSMLKEYPPTENDYSIGVKLTLGDFELFSGGDLSGHNVLRQYGPHKESYNDMESRLASGIGSVEVYHVNHHGSRFSSNRCFVSVLRPLVSVISTGKNTYGHPDPGVYQRLKKVGEVRITGGADVRVAAAMGDDIVGDDIEILVAPGGGSFWLNGVPHQSLSEEQEAARSGTMTHCDDTLGNKHDPAIYELPEEMGGPPD